MVVLEEVGEVEVMLMLGQAEALGPGLDHSHTAMISKGKRTKRQRPHSPLALSLVSYSSSSGHGGGDDRVVTSPEPMATSGGELDGKIVKEDEEDNEAGIAANCLMLMSQGRTQCKQQPEMGIKAATATARTANNDAYQCRTCDRCFPSFQALGGHRASHKKPKGGANLEDKKPPSSTSHGSLEDGGLIRNNGGNKSSSPPLSTSSLLPLTNNSIKSCRVHECGICGAEFASGQALGGHMRRHRMTVGGSGGGANTRNTEEDFLLRQSPSPAKKKSKSVVLSLDLNLAPPEESKFAPFAKEHTLVFSTSPLVDCHY